MNKLLVRTLSGIIYAAVIVLCIIWGVDGIALLGSLLATWAILEFSNLLKPLSRESLPTLLLDVAGVVSLTLWVFGFPIIIWLAIILCRFIEQLYLRSENPIADLSHSMMGQLYIGLTLGCMVTLGTLAPRRTLLLAIFLFIWINDTGAFLIGSAFGRHRLFERVSPKKSWEGFFGGVVFNIIAAVLFCAFLSDFFGLPENYWLWLGLAMVITIFGTWGDLVESMMKRTLKIKDSGSFIPGHGGILDRIDSLLFAAPAVLLYFYLYISL